MAVSRYYHLQCNFNAGEISPEVANQVTLEKYKYALLKAENALIRPHGPVYKRPGTEYVAAALSNNALQQSILVPFTGADNQDYVLEFGNLQLRVYKNGVAIANGVTPFTSDDLVALRFAQSANTMFITSGKYPVKKLVRITDNNWTFGNFTIDYPYFDTTILDASADCTIAPSAKTGNITLTANESIFFSSIVGHQIQLEQEVESSSVTKGFTSSNLTPTNAVYVGGNWQVISHGTWTGTFVVEQSADGVTWTQYRLYTSANDFNPNESGSVSDGLYLRLKATSMTSGTCNATLTAMPYSHKGRAQITGYTSGTVVSATVLDDFGTTTATKDWKCSAWGPAFGYPMTLTFFQDRLCFGGSSSQPHMLWMSRTGDYGNFEVEKVAGSVTDDSAVAASLISRKQFDIKHLVATTDLLILTEGNEWLVSGSEVVTPSKITPKMQTARGCSNVEPMSIGNKLIYVQSRGAVVRDMGYSFESDSYTGNDLTLLASHLVEGHDIVDCAYKQQPDSVIYFVRDDGVLLCLSYVIEQNVYAWSTIKTGGKVEAICCVREGDKDVLYATVLRLDLIPANKKRTIERFANNDSSGTMPTGYICLDCCSEFWDIITATNTFSVPHLAGKTVDVVGDGRVYKDCHVDDNGSVTIAGSVNHAVVGFPYTTNLELPNIEIKINDGTMQGRQKHISECILRLNNSLGGKVGIDFTNQDEIKYDELSAVSNIKLYSGDKKVVLPIGGFNIDGRITITSAMPYPFELLMAVREVTFGG